MVPFNLWFESFIFTLILGVIILVPCFFVGFFGKKMIDGIGRYPSRTPAIQLDILWKLVIVEVVTFSLLMSFYQFFSVK